MLVGGKAKRANGQEKYFFTYEGKTLISSLVICESDAAIPCWNNEMYEPLHAAYRRSVPLTYLEKCESQSLRGMVKDLNATYVPVDRLRRYDPALQTFTNINHLDELDRFNTMDKM